jgi:hypothetical protein
MQIEQEVGEFRRRKNHSLDAALGADEERLGSRLQTDQGSRDGEPWVEMATRTATSEEESHAGAANGLVARAPTTRSRVLPMLARIPVINIEMTRFERP